MRCAIALALYRPTTTTKISETSIRRKRTKFHSVAWPHAHPSPLLPPPLPPPSSGHPSLHPLSQNSASPSPHEALIPFPLCVAKCRLGGRGKVQLLRAPIKSRLCALNSAHANLCPLRGWTAVLLAIYQVAVVTAGSPVRLGGLAGTWVLGVLGKLLV